MAEQKVRVAVIFGGRSGEHAVSLMSAKFVLQMLRPAKYEVTQVGITRAGAWLLLSLPVVFWLGRSQLSPSRVPARRTRR